MGVDEAPPTNPTLYRDGDGFERSRHTPAHTGTPGPPDSGPDSPSTRNIKGGAQRTQDPL